MLRVDKKLREAHFFLSKMVELSRLAFSDSEEIDFYLSAFLSAGRSVDYRLRSEQKAAYCSFYEGWERRLSTDERQLFKFLMDDRALEVHHSGSSRVEKEERISVQSMYRDDSGTSIVSAPLDTPPAEIIKTTFVFQLNGKDEPLVDVCTKYVELLARLVEDYRRSVGLTS